MTDEEIWAMWRESFDVHSMEVDMAFARKIERAAIMRERERTQALTNAAEQFVAWQNDIPKSSMLDYFAEIFSEALRTRGE